MSYTFPDIKKVMRNFSGITNIKARKEIEELAGELFHLHNMNAGDIIYTINKSMRIALLNEGIEKD